MKISKKILTNLTDDFANGHHNDFLKIWSIRCLLFCNQFLIFWTIVIFQFIKKFHRWVQRAQMARTKSRNIFHWKICLDKNENVRSLDTMKHTITQNTYHQLQILPVRTIILQSQNLPIFQWTIQLQQIPENLNAEIRFVLGFCEVFGDFAAVN